jgi:peptidoglycan/LPS O-acetylase OafA/YrhL
MLRRVGHVQKEAQTARSEYVPSHSLPPFAFPKNHPDMENKRLTQIDLLRFLSAVSVVLFHYTFHYTLTGNTTDRGNLLYPYLAEVTRYGQLGVEMFFLISGFVIMMTASRGSARQFVTSRITRLYPAFWFCCTVTFLVSLYFGQGLFPVSVTQYLVNMTMLNGFARVEHIDGVYWTLFVELRFYLLIFLVLLFNRLKDIKKLLAAWLIISCALSGYTVRYVSLLLFPEYSAFFIAGAFFYFIHQEGVSWRKLSVLAACFGLIAWQVPARAAVMEKAYSTGFNSVIMTGLIFAFFVIFFLIATRRWTLAPKPIWIALGAITYPLYLIHQNIGYILFRYLHGNVNVHALVWGMILVMMGVAYLIHLGIERPGAACLKRLLTLSGRKAETAAAQAAPTVIATPTAQSAETTA